MVLGSVVSLLARREVPTMVGASPYDSGLFVRQANYLVDGRWLGPFDNLTLAKGPAYPLFIAFTHEVGIPLKLGEHLTWLAAALAVAGCFWLVTRRRALSAAIYLVLVLCPDSFGDANAGVVRDGWYASLTLLFLSSLFLALYGALCRVRLVWVVISSAVCGLSGAAFWLCREEGPWILPAAAVIAVAMPLAAVLRWLGRSRRRRTTGRPLLRYAGRYVLAASVVGALFAAPVAFVMVQNHERYGTTLTNDFASGAFARAYADWGRVEAGSPEPLVPITRAQRAAVYRVSPAARELEPALESPSNRWLRLSCPAEHEITGCDILGSVTAWAIRDAAARAGHFGSEPAAQRFFAEVSEQIDAACAAHQLACRPRLPLYLQPVQQLNARQAVHTFGDNAHEAVWSAEFTTPTRVAVPLPQPAHDAARAVVRPIASNQQAQVDQLRQFASRHWPYRVLADVYRLILPLILMLGLAGAVLGFARPRWPRVALSVLCLAFAMGVVSRLALLTIVDLTQFSADVARYQLPTRALLYAFGTVGTALLFDQLGNWRHSRRRVATTGPAHDPSLDQAPQANPAGAVSTGP